MANVVSRTFSILITILFSLISTTTSTFPPPHIPVYPLPLSPSANHAALALHYAGLNSMSLVMYLYSADYPLIPIPFPPIALTVFAPRDSAFATKGQPSEPQLLHHFSPVYIPPNLLRSLASNSTLRTFASDTDHLTVTPRDGSKAVFINNVLVDKVPIYDDHQSIVVYAIDDFFEYDVTREEKVASADGDQRCVSLEKFSGFLDPQPMMFFPVALVLRWMNKWCHFQGVLMDYSASVFKNLLFT